MEKQHIFSNDIAAAIGGDVDEIFKEHIEEFPEDKDMNPYTWAQDALDNDELEFFENLPNDKPVCVDGVVACWDGAHPLYEHQHPKRFETFQGLKDTLESIFFDGNDRDYEIFIDEDDNLAVTWSDHDTPMGGTKLIISFVDETNDLGEATKVSPISADYVRNGVTPQ